MQDKGTYWKRAQLTGLAAFLLASAFPAVSAEKNTAEYLVSIYGITIARSSFTSTIDADSYRVDGTVSSSGMAAIFDDTKGTISTSGSIRNGVASPQTHSLDYTSGKKKQRTTVRLENGNVVATENVPPPKPRRHGWVPVEAGQLNAVVDPLTATLVKAENLDEVCNRTVKIYDGEMRADLALTYHSKTPVVAGDFKGDGVTCRVRFKPISGYRQGSSTIEYLSAGHDMRVTFARMGSSQYFVPVRGQVATKIGTVHFRVGKMN